MNHMESSSSLTPRHAKPKPSKKIRLESEEEDEGSSGNELEDTAQYEVDDKTHDTLIQSLKATFQTKKKRRRPEEDGRALLDSKGKLILRPTIGPSTSTSFNVLDFIDENNAEVVKKVKAVVKPSKKKDGEKQMSLTTTLGKPVVKRIRREVLYNNANKEVSKWNSVVYHNRLADQLVFPLPDSSKLKKGKAKEDLNDFVPMTAFEEKLAKLIHGEGYVERKKAEVCGQKATDNKEVSYAQTVQDALNRHHEQARLRAIQSYEMAKAKRQGKIKSKKYHRLQRREKIRKQLREFEELQKTDPEAAMVKLEELDRARVEERMSLKHRNTSKWARAQTVRAKYNRESRAELSEQLKISKELTRKVAESSSDSDPDDSDLDLPSLVKSSLDNPWCLTGSVKDNDKVNMYYTGYRKFWDEVNKRKERERKRAEREEERQKQKDKERKAKDASQMLEKQVDENEPQHQVPVPTKKSKKSRKVTVKKSVQPEQLVSAADIPQLMTVDDLDNLFTLANEKLKEQVGKEVKRLKSEKSKFEIETSKKNEKARGNRSKKQMRNKDGDADEIRDLNVDETEINCERGGSQGEEEDASVQLQTLSKSSVERVEKVSKPAVPASETVIDPSHFLEIRKSTKYDMKETDIDFGDETVPPEEGDEDEKEHLQMIAEAFEDEDLLGEFERRKAAEIDRGKPEEVNLILPGWGEWGSKGRKPSKRKRKFLKKAPRPPKRKDSALPHVILNEGGEEKIREHRVKELPFPFTRVAEFEKMMRAPIGRTWVPEPAMKDLIAPKVITRLGAVVQPIGEDVLAKEPSKSKPLKLVH